jgi:tetratricopeptide (TPR) repeat protein
MRPPTAMRLAGAILFAAALAACAPMPTEAPKPVAPQITEDTLRVRAMEQLATGVKQYDAGDYDGAMKSLQASLDHGLLEKSDQSRARKYLAFVHCLGGREPQCAAEFRKAFEIDQSFALTAAEDGHPIWGPVYRTVRATLIAEREAAQGKPKAALPKAEQKLVDGLVKYEAGEYAEAHRLLEEAVKDGLAEKKDQVRALKYAAFSLCLQNKWPACRAEFLRIYDIDPDFDLTPAEAGHPSWTRTFAGAKAQAKKAQADKAAAEKSQKKAP